ncbi:MAG: hypothetical protein ACLSH6_03290 [Limosilactobacillus pontis]
MDEKQKVATALSKALPEMDITAIVDKIERPKDAKNGTMPSQPSSWLKPCTRLPR